VRSDGEPRRTDDSNESSWVKDCLTGKYTVRHRVMLRGSGRRVESYGRCELSHQSLGMMARSLLYVPGDNPSMLERAPQRGADALILDLEDAVAARSKDEARSRVATWIAKYASGAECEIWVRVNSGGRLVEDISAVLHPDVSGIVLPKATTTTVGDADVALGRAEGAYGLEIGHVLVVALIESAIGLLDLRDIAAHPRVRQLALGEVDLSADLGIEVSDDESELQPFRPVWSSHPLQRASQRRSDLLQPKSMMSNVCMPRRNDCAGWAFALGKRFIHRRSRSSTRCSRPATRRCGAQGTSCNCSILQSRGAKA
jgi:hypothetical protein